MQEASQFNNNSIYRIGHVKDSVWQFWEVNSKINDRPWTTDSSMNIFMWSRMSTETVFVFFLLKSYSFHANFRLCYIIAGFSSWKQTELLAEIYSSLAFKSRLSSQCKTCLHYRSGTRANSRRIHSEKSCRNTCYAGLAVRRQLTPYNIRKLNTTRVPLVPVMQRGSVN